jgi:hypothetical protein
MLLMGGEKSPRREIVEQKDQFFITLLLTW